MSHARRLLAHLSLTHSEENLTVITQYAEQMSDQQTSKPQPVAVVTGANSGIGRATAIYLALQGFRVFGTVRSLDKAAKLVALAEKLGVAIELVEMDVADDASVRQGFADIFRASPRIDVLINNAGIGGNGVTEETTPEQYFDSFNVNVVGVVRCTQQVLPQMRASKTAQSLIFHQLSVASRLLRNRHTSLQSGRLKDSPKVLHTKLHHLVFVSS